MRPLWRARLHPVARLSARACWDGRKSMARIFMIALAVTVLMLSSTAFAQQPGQFGNAGEAKAMLAKAVAALKADKAKALNIFNTGEAGFLDRDLYPFCFNVSDGKHLATQAKQLVGQDIRILKDPTGKAFGWNSTLRRRSRKGKSLRSPTCFQSRSPTRHRVRI